MPIANLRLRLPSIGSVFAVALGFAAALSAQASAQTFTFFPTPTTTSDPREITVGPDGNLWFSAPGRGTGTVPHFDRITTAGVITEFSTPVVANKTRGITAGPDGAVWFTEVNADRIARTTTAGVVTEFPIPHTGTCSPSCFLPLGIAAGADGALWFTENLGNKIGRITTDGAISEFSVPTATAGLAGITPGPDGALWFIEDVVAKIGRITSAGVVTEFSQIPIGSLGGITTGPDGNLWFTISLSSDSTGRIGRLTPAGTVTLFATPTPISTPTGIAVGGDGNLWFTEKAVGNIGRITTAGVITEFPIPGAGEPFGITAGPDGNIWFTIHSATTGDAIGRLAPATGATPLVAAVLPGSRSVQVGGNATAFATILNSGASDLSSCRITPITPVPATFLYQTTDPATNALTGSPNTPASIPAGGFQTFLMAFAATAPMSSTNVVLGFDCSQVAPVATIVGINTLLLTFSATPVPDMIAVGLTPSNDGYSRTGGAGGTGIFVIASTNIGTPAQLTARARLFDAAMPMTTLICETDSQTGQCKATPSATVTRTIAQNENTTWTAFLTANGSIAQDPARNRVYFEFIDTNAIVRGSTSTAVTTQ